MFRETATAMDAAFKIAAVETPSVAQIFVRGFGALHATFPENHEDDFDDFARCVVRKLGLEDEGISFYDDCPMEEDDEGEDDDVDGGDIIDADLVARGCDRGDKDGGK